MRIGLVWEEAGAEIRFVLYSILCGIFCSEETTWYTSCSTFGLLLGQCPYFFAAIQKSVAQDVVICRNLRMIEQSGEGAVLGTSLNSKPDRVGPAALCSCITPLTAPATLTYTTVVGVQGVGLSFSGCCGAWAAGSATSGWQGSVFHMEPRPNEDTQLHCEILSVFVEGCLVGLVMTSLRIRSLGV